MTTTIRLVNARFSLRTAATWLWSCSYGGFVRNVLISESGDGILCVQVFACVGSFLSQLGASPWLWNPPPQLISCEDSPFGDTWRHSSSQCIEHAPSACSALSSQTQMVISVVEIGWGNAIFSSLCTLWFFKPSQCFLQHPTVLVAKASRLLCMAAFHMICSVGVFLCVSFDFMKKKKLLKTKRHRVIYHIVVERNIADPLISMVRHTSEPQNVDDLQMLEWCLGYKSGGWANNSELVFS